MASTARDGRYDQKHLLIRENYGGVVPRSSTINHEGQK